MIFGKKNLGINVKIDFSPEAKKWITGNSMNKKIYTFYNKSLIKVENYNIVKHKMLIKQNIFIRDKTSGVDKPVDAIDTPILRQTLSNIELMRRLR